MKTAVKEAVTSAVLFTNKEIADLKEDVEKKGEEMLMMHSRSRAIVMPQI